jgi:hypothetical protein
MAAIARHHAGWTATHYGAPRRGWSYDTERREKRTVWYHVANAFSLLVATMAPMPSNEQIKVISNYDR